MLKVTMEMWNEYWVILKQLPSHTSDVVTSLRLWSLECFTLCSLVENEKQAPLSYLDRTIFKVSHFLASHFINIPLESQLSLSKQTKNKVFRENSKVTIFKWVFRYFSKWNKYSVFSCLFVCVFHTTGKYNLQQYARSDDVNISNMGRFRFLYISEQWSWSLRSLLSHTN